MIAIQWEDVIGVLQTCRPDLIALGVLWIAAVIIMIACRKVKKKSKKKKKRGWFEGSYPVLCALIYLLIGFLCNLWHPGWLVFLTIPIYYTFEGCMYGTGNFKTALKATWPVCCAMIFLVLGCVWGLWHPGWLVFLTVPIIECL